MGNEYDEAFFCFLMPEAFVCFTQSASSASKLRQSSLGYVGREAARLRRPGQPEHLFL
jgi:hypothetical protein